jgi:hypothetical protein
MDATSSIILDLLLEGTLLAVFLTFYWGKLVLFTFKSNLYLRI